MSDSDKYLLFSMVSLIAAQVTEGYLMFLFSGMTVLWGVLTVLSLLIEMAERRKV